MTAVKKTQSNRTIPESFSLVSCDKKNVIVETIKKAENNGNIILRMFDCNNMTTSATLTFGFDVKKAYICDLLENIETELTVSNNTVIIPVKNFEIITLMLEV